MESMLEVFLWARRIFRLLADDPTKIHSRRTLNREQGRALELIGHGVDYLVDSYVHEGADDELIDVGAFSKDAIQILVSMRLQILLSAHVPAIEGRRICTTVTPPILGSCPSNQINPY